MKLISLRASSSRLSKGEDGAKAVIGYGGSRFRKDEDGNNSEQNGRWIMYVVYSMKKNEEGQRKEKADLGKKQSKSKQIDEKNEPGQGATGRKRKLKQTATSNKKDDNGDTGFQYKRLKSEQGALRIQQNQPVELPYASDVLEVLHSEESYGNSEFSGRPIEDLLNSITFEDLVIIAIKVEKLTQFYAHEGDECSQNNHLMGE
ncbi:hypothetical protein OWV82_020403 [Melia azedarach]|uniref:Uncharacterized protein n=1 Tax=Melia azedarach TaxID=155640 RepID=A0ACC1X606_MELAZ|nr:hypothetical protein OWV82_020403 [Melia azedarach]